MTTTFYERVFAGMTWNEFKNYVRGFIEYDSLLHPGEYKTSPLKGAKLKDRLEGIKGDGYLDFIVGFQVEEVDGNLDVMLWPIQEEHKADDYLELSDLLDVEHRRRAVDDFFHRLTEYLDSHFPEKTRTCQTISP